MSSVNKDVWGNVKNTYYWGGTGDSISQLVQENKLTLNTQYDTSIAICNLNNAPKIRVIYFPVNWFGGYENMCYLDNNNSQMTYFTESNDEYILRLKNSAMPLPLNENDFPSGVEDQWKPSATKYTSAYPVLQLDPYRVCLLPVITALSVDPTGKSRNEDLSSYMSADIDLDT